MKRINLYTDLALPLVEWYEKQWNLIEINADQPIEDVFSELEEKLALGQDICSSKGLSNQLYKCCKYTRWLIWAK